MLKDVESLSGTSSLAPRRTEKATPGGSDRALALRKCVRVLSATGDVHPLCNACAESRCKSIAKRLAEEKRYQKRYQDFCANLGLSRGDDAMRTSTDGESNDTTGAEETMGPEDLKKSLLDLKRRLKERAARRVDIENRNRSLAEHIRNLEIEASSCWTKNCDHKLLLTRYVQKFQSLSTRGDYFARKLEGLNTTNIFNDAFFIWFDGPIGTINGFRLGRLPNQPVPCSEINAAWGQAAILLATIEKRHKGFKFQRYRVVPMGSYSKLGPYGNLSRPLPLFWDGGWRKGAFNRAMVAILTCLDELGIYASAFDRTIQMPYKIKGKTIGGNSIELGDWYKWTCALKYFLTNLKWLVAWSAKH